MTELTPGERIRIVAGPTSGPVYKGKSIGDTKEVLILQLYSRDGRTYAETVSDCSEEILVEGEPKVSNTIEGYITYPYKFEKVLAK